MHSLRLNNIFKTYPDGTQALSDVSLTFHTGMVGLLGPNGAGKSSLMRTIACLQLPDSGDVLFTLDNHTVNVIEQPEFMRKALGYLPQSFGVYPNMSCLALLKHLAVLKGLSAEQQEEQIPELLALTNLTDVARKSVSTFSGGMRQRFGIAQALLGDPSIIIMDEPTAGLDPQEREKFHDMLVTISQQKLVILSTHIVEDVENLCSHVTLLFDGKISASDSVPTLLKTLQGKVWQQSRPHSITLSKTYRYGQPSYRVFHDTTSVQDGSTSLHEDAVAVTPTLQDLYFLQLRQVQEATC